MYERPVNSGNLFYENNQPAGRVEVTRDAKGRIVGKEFDFTAKHKEFRTPLGIIMSAVELLRNYLDRLPAPKRAQLLDDIHQKSLAPI